MQKQAPLYITCQFGQVHQRPWHTKDKMSGSICKSEQVKPNNGVLVDQIISAQPGLIPQMWVLLTSQRL